MHLKKKKNKKIMDFLSRIFQNFQLGIFSQQLGIKYTFCHWEWGPISAPNEVKKEHCLSLQKSRFFNIADVSLKNFM